MDLYSNKTQQDLLNTFEQFNLRTLKSAREILESFSGHLIIILPNTPSHVEERNWIQENLPQTIQKISFLSMDEPEPLNLSADSSTRSPFGVLCIENNSSLTVLQQTLRAQKLTPEFCIVLSHERAYRHNFEIKNIHLIESAYPISLSLLLGSFSYPYKQVELLQEASKSLAQQLKAGNQVFFTFAGALSTAGIGKILSQWIRNGWIAGISCTGANLEEDFFRLMGLPYYLQVPNYRDLSAKDESQIKKSLFSRVTDCAMPQSIFEEVGDLFLRALRSLLRQGKRSFPYEVFYEIIRRESFLSQCRNNPQESWLVAGQEHNIPVWTPGWEDSTLGNIFAVQCTKGSLQSSDIKSGIESMMSLMDFYIQRTQQRSLAFLQMGGGIAGDFPICVVPTLRTGLDLSKTPLWSYFLQVNDSTTSFGSYSGAPPLEKISWGKIDADTPSYTIESDVTLVLPIIDFFVKNELRSL